MWSVDVGLIAEWLASLDVDSREQVVAAIRLLEDRGPQLGRPIVDSVTDSKYANMKELRPGSSGRSELRALFAFDPKRQATSDHVRCGRQCRKLGSMVQEKHPRG
ncbi:type II toxin-antitoxin system RelE/ParE family toxin [Paeniglutamicibacter gangotriensis]|uniref:type II toxin-antitoxin system RelE/ParE family toxin n=1 Tax=Paeniglutamicibacter gangotriensis TaxID=254787 RepID=UPI001CB6E7A1